MEVGARSLLHAQVERRGRSLTVPIILLLNAADSEALAQCRSQLHSELVSTVQEHLGELLPEAS